MKLGVVRVRLISADVNKTLENIGKSGMILRSLRIKDGLTAEFRVQKSELRTLNRLAQQRGDQIEIISHEGIYWGIRHLIRRPIMVAGVLILLFLTLWLPSRVLFLQVEGNSSVPTRLILEAAGECGIGFGAKSRDVRSERMKNALLQQIPTLQWAGINTDGCIATISVREKTVQMQEDVRYPVSSMVAVRDGYITQMTVTAGSPGCKVGQSVEKGQVLISAYTDCGTHLRADRAEGEVFANTKHGITAVTPVKSVRKGEQRRVEQRFGVLFGKKLINLSKGSGIWEQECDRIKSVHYITLPGGFRFPVGIVTETVVYYDTSESDVSQPESEEELIHQAERYLIQNMIAGKIEKSVISCRIESENYILNGSYDCNEMICQIRTEEILQTDEQRN